MSSLLQLVPISDLCYSKTNVCMSELISNNHLSPLQTFKLFEKLAEHDRERHLREESRSVPPAVQELEIATEETEEQSTEESCPSQAVDGPAPSSSAASVSTPAHSSGQLAQGEKAAAAGTASAEE